MKRNPLIANTALLILPIVLSLSGLLACSQLSKPATAAESATAAPLAVDTIVATREKVEPVIVATGTLSAIEEATVSVESEGRIIALPADLGDHVGRGAMLLKVAPELYVYQKAQADAEVEAARADYQRLKELTDKQLSPQQTLETAKRRLDVGTAAADYQRKKLDDTVLRAPIEGTIAKRLVNLGEYIKAGTPAFLISRTSPLKAKVPVPERYFDQIAKGAAVTAYLEGRDNLPLTGKVTRISPNVESDTRSFSLEAQVDNPKGTVKPGSFARVEIRASGIVEAVTVPEKALYSFAGARRVYVADGGKAVERNVVLGIKTGDRWVVEKGLEVGDKVITSSIEQLSDGRAITVR